jgi:5-formyltetrahydrofolate cyclo-ligase
MSINNKVLRKRILNCRDTLTAAEQIEKSAQIIDNLSKMVEVEQSSTLFIYVDFRSEVQTLPFVKKCLSAGKTVTVPLTLIAEKKLLAIGITDVEKDLQPGYAGIPEPGKNLQQTAQVDPGTIDTVILPGSVFDRQGARLGYGGGYYDRFLVDAAPQALRLAVAYEIQLVEKVELQPHDQLMDWIITEKNIYSCKR